MIKLQYFFLLNFYDNLIGNIESILRYFNSLSTSKWGDHLILSEQSQNVMELSEFIVKNSLRFFNIVIEWSWYGWTDESKICLATGIALVMTTI